MEIVNLIISILSLIATITISFVIYFLEQHNQKEIKNKEIKENAKRFIIENDKEIDYLHWATIAAGCFPQNKHIRKIYNEFAYLDDATKKEVLKQRGLNCKLISGNGWIYKKIEMIQNAINELGIGDDFLYDGGKYLTRAYRYKNKSIKELEKKRYENDKYNDYFKLNRMFLKHKNKLTYEQYLEDYLYCKYDNPELMPKDKEVCRPNDYLISVEELRNCREDYLCYWMMVMVENVICYACRYMHYKESGHSETDAQVEKYEDKYFSVLYEMYYFDKIKGKSRTNYIK